MRFTYEIGQLALSDRRQIERRPAPAEIIRSQLAVYLINRIGRQAIEEPLVKAACDRKFHLFTSHDLNRRDRLKN